MDTLIRLNKGTDSRLRNVSTLKRTWTLTIACLGVALVICRLGDQSGAPGTHLAEISSSAFFAVAAALIGLWAPGRDGRQLRIAQN